VDEIGDYIACYSIAVGSNVTIEDIKNAQLEFIRNFVSLIQNNPNITNIIIVGHHPLAQYKMKKDKLRFMILNPELNEMIYRNIFKELNPNIRYYYLCADLHQYQSGNIIINGDMSIKQYIVGTAGAQKDDINIDLLVGMEQPQIRENIQYLMDSRDMETITNDNGYLICNTNDSMLEFEFVRVSSIGGRRRKSRRKRMKKGGKTKKRKQNGF
jgi:hypothetical protein